MRKRFNCGMDTVVTPGLRVSRKSYKISEYRSFVYSARRAASLRQVAIPKVQKSTNWFQPGQTRFASVGQRQTGYMPTRSDDQKEHRGFRQRRTRHVSRRANQLDIHKEILSSGPWQRCPRCQSQAAFCGACAAKFDEMVPEALCRQLAFGADVELEFKQMLEELSYRVDEESRCNRNAEIFPGSVQTSKERRRTKAIVLEGLCVNNLSQKIERDKHEKSGLLMKQSPIDVMPAETIQWLAGIDDSTRSWIYTRNERVRIHDRWLQSNAADREITHLDKKIDVSQEFPSVVSLKSLTKGEFKYGKLTAARRQLLPLSPMFTESYTRGQS